MKTKHFHFLVLHSCVKSHNLEAIIKKVMTNISPISTSNESFEKLKK